jgi:hypothetical protein
MRMRCCGNVLAKRLADATRRSRVNRVWPLRGLRLKSCCTVALTCANPRTASYASAIASVANSHSRAESYTRTTGINIHCYWCRP